ncbi:hypothetical protein ACFP81_10645 [Deinococcus lacus]|uniref:Mu-like prophage FluMu N-terminal domain-containing protein n=1 Tax=Deinococcus lacus TaxID=392561 RepID=A0ABW1YDM3_9DEIO
MFLRKTPDGKTEKLDANGKPVTVQTEAKAEAKKAQDDLPTLKTGDLPHNIGGAAKLKEADITTYEALREKSTAELVALGLTGEQAEKALATANKPE